MALSASSEASDIREGGGTTEAYDAAEDQMRAFSVATDILGGLAIAGGVAALVLTLSSGSSSQPSATAAHRGRPGDLRFTF